jgi:hypothetical protein
VTQAKGFELLEFIRSYNGEVVEYLDELDQRWIGNFITNPNQTTSRSLDVGNANAMFAHVTITVEFEGTLQ